MRRMLLSVGLLSFVATSAMAQVQIDVRLDKARYLAGEPIVVVIEVRNVGQEAVGYSACGTDVHLDVTGAERRVPPNIFGCFRGGGGGGGAGVCVSDHPPLLQPAQTTTVKYLLKEYDLRPGQYQLTASGAQFERTLPVTVVASTERELQAAFAPLVADADAKDAMRRYAARAAIAESAPPFLESLIARFAAEAPPDAWDTSAVDALGRLASANSRTHLKELFRGSRPTRRSAMALLALAGIGHQEDADFFASVLQDETMDQTSRRYAAAGLGRVGGDQAVQHLERALVTTPADLRPWIATALGNTRSRAAGPVLIGMYGNNPSRNDVCGALTTLTHEHWCGTADDPAGLRRRWLRRWNENGSTISIFGPDNCLVKPVVAPLPAPPPTFVVPAPPSPPRMSPVTELRLTGISPPTPHPSQGVLLRTNTGGQVGDQALLTDARGRQWRIGTGVSLLDIVLTLPDEVADGQASVRVARQVNGADAFSAPFTFVVASGPLPLKPLAVSMMRPVSPGQWTDLVKDSEVAFEVRRADRIDVEFHQGDVTEIRQATGPDDVHVNVPARLIPGPVQVRTRTWIEQTASEWSAPVPFTVEAEPAPPLIMYIEVGPLRTLMWWSGLSSSAAVQARPGDALVLRGHFPVATAAELRVQIRGPQATFELQATDVDGGVRVELPSQASSGEWRLVVGTRDGSTPPREVTTVRVM